MRMSITFATQRPWGLAARLSKLATEAVCASHNYNSGFLDCHFVSNVSSFRRCFFRSDTRSPSSVNVKASTSGNDAKSCSVQHQPPTHRHKLQLVNKGSLEVRLLHGGIGCAYEKPLTAASNCLAKPLKPWRLSHTPVNVIVSVFDCICSNSSTCGRRGYC